MTPDVDVVVVADPEEAARRTAELLAGVARAGVRAAFLNAIQAAMERSRELAEGET